MIQNEDGYKLMGHAEFSAMRMKTDQNTTMELILSYCKGILFCFFVLFSAFFGFLWCFPIGLILCLINHTWCMHLMNTVQFVWNAFICQLLKSLYDLKYTMYGDLIGSERCCVLGNHSTRLDWLLMLPLILENDRLKELRFSLKAPLKNVPGVGWSLQFLRHIFLQRNFENDKGHIRALFKFYKEHLRNIFFVLYPEGTVMWPDTRQKSDKFAAANGLKPYKHLLLPRITGFKYIYEQCLATGIDTIYDITSVYEEKIPQDEKAFFQNGMPKEIKYFITKYNIKDVQNDPEKFIYTVWEVKDKQMTDYYDHGRITLKENEIQVPFTVMMAQKIGLFFWVWFVLHNFRFFWFYMPLTLPSLIIFAYLMNKYGDLAKFNLDDKKTS